jgi:hypothetical protein
MNQSNRTNFGLKFDLIRNEFTNQEDDSIGIRFVTNSNSS